MKAQPIKQTSTGQEPCEAKDATHLKIKMESVGISILPVVIGNKSRAGTNCWSWNGCTDKPTLRPSIKTMYTDPLTDDELAIIDAGGTIPNRESQVCHVWLNDGMVQYLGDCTHEYANQTRPLVDLP